jgi:Na+/H+ antiporter NhaD/arsenite permease-like protein
MNKVVRRIRAMTAQQSIDVDRIEQSGMDAFYERMCQRDIFLHVSEVSVAMIGVCLTGVSILNVDQDINDLNTYVDDLLAIDSFIFLTSYLLSYWVVRVMTKSDSPKERLRQRNVRRIGSIANAVFLIGMIFMAIVCASIVLQGDYSPDT